VRRSQKCAEKRDVIFRSVGGEVTLVKIHSDTSHGEPGLDSELSCVLVDA